MKQKQILKEFRKVLQANYSDNFVNVTDWTPVQDFILQIAGGFKEPEPEEHLGTCVRCLRRLPNDYIHAYVEGGEAMKTQDVCSVCALEMRNKTAGLLLDTPFTGTLAREFYEKTVAYYKKTNQHEEA